MSFIDVTQEVSVGVKIIDDQHITIANIINDIHKSFLESNSESINTLLNYLADEIRIHFETEEKLMKDNRFTGYFSHKLEHDRFYKQILSIADNVNAGKATITSDNLESLRRWFFNHIEINDKKCGSFLSSIGIK